MSEREAVLDDDVAARRGRGRWLPVAAVAAAVTLLAGGAYGVNRITDGTPATEPRPLALTPNPGGGAALHESAVYPASSVFHRVTGELPALDAAEAPVYGYGEAIDEATVRELAATLKVSGEPRLVGDAWEVGPEQPGVAGARLMVTADGEGAWRVTGPDHALTRSVPPPGDTPPADPTEGPAVEPAPGMPADPDGSQSSPAMPEPAGPEPVMPPRDLPDDSGAEPGAPDAERVVPGPHDGERGLVDAPVPEDLLLPDGPAGPPPSAEEALAAVVPLLERLGLDPAAAEATDTAGDRRTVRVARQVDSLPAPGLGTRLEVDARGVVVSGQGTLGDPVSGDAPYPLIDAAEALLALNGGIAEPPEAAAVVEVSEVGLGLVRHRVAGEPVLVPAWLFTPAMAPDAEPVARVAVTPELLTGVSDDVAPSTGGASEPGDPGTVDLDGAVGRAPDSDFSGETWSLEPAEATATSLVYHDSTGACGEYEAFAEETPDTITITVEQIDPDPDQICTLQLVPGTFDVELDEPLGDRTVRNSLGAEIEVPGR
ncbi:hypothetical protein [Streptomyces spiramenti]|uniref:Large membrane protein n=1 Tax=Streptomyces spiramenti TaxID=2720606 RepID=A0ABX1AI41_9ACTN|nr:hypothetical protein [Streptomyces spiramenti]NJP65581.1 hypothetical protein [Streptomyces spiramenti]